jgi:ATP-binding cassette subfamily B protein
MSPIARFFQLIRSERQDLALLGTYTLLVVVLTLAVPLAVQSLVNTIAAGLFVQPVVVLSLVVLCGLGIAGFMQVLEFGIVETLQQRVFAETALTLSGRIVNVHNEAMRAQYGPELMNRFFDVLTVQKALNKLFLDGFTAAIQIIVTLIVLGVFNPVLLLSATVVVVLFLGATILLGFGGIKSSLNESKQKYVVAEWLEDLARCHIAFKLFGTKKMISERTDEMVSTYLKARRSHFQVNRRQLSGFFVFQAFASAGVLAAGARLC